MAQLDDEYRYVKEKIRFRLEPLKGENGAADYNLWRFVEGYATARFDIVHFTGLATTVNLLITMVDPVGRIQNHITDFPPEFREKFIDHRIILTSVREMMDKHWKGH